MLGIDPKVARITWSVAATLLVLFLLYEARGAVLLFVASSSAVANTSPVVSLVDRFAPKRAPRTLSLAVVYILLILGLTTAVATVSARASEQAATLVTRMPEFAESARKLSTTTWPYWIEPLRPHVAEMLQGQLEGGVEKALPMLRHAATQILGALGSLGFALLIPILGFLILKDAAEHREVLVSVFSRAVGRDHVEGLLDDMHVMLGQYIRALALLSVVAFLAYELFFLTAGVPYGALLAVVGGVLEFIPLAGPAATAVVACLVALISGYPHVGMMVVFFIALRLFQDYVMQPLLLGTGLELNPLLILFGALVGEEVGGIIGMILSVPIMAALRLVWLRSLRQSTKTT